MQKATLKNRLHLTGGFLVNVVSVLGNVSVPGARSPKNQGSIDVQRVQNMYVLYIYIFKYTHIKDQSLSLVS